MMATTTTVTREELIEETLDSLYRETERPLQLAVGSNALTSSSDTTLTLSDADSVHVPAILEKAGELVLVTAKSDDATPVFTVARGYGGSTATEGWTTGSTVLLNPVWPRHLVSRWIERAIASVFNKFLPQVASQSLTVESDTQYIEMPANTIRVFTVRHYNTITGRITDVGGWRFEDDLPTAIVATGKALRTASFVTVDDDVIVTYQTPYAFSATTEAGEIELPLGTEDIPALWASAYATSRREVSRSELDKVEEWNQEQAIRAGVNLRMVRDLWGEVYRRIDEARAIQNVPRPRVYRKMARV